MTPSGPLHVHSPLTFKDGSGGRWGLPHPSRLISPLSVPSAPPGTSLLASAVTDAVATEGFLRSLKGVDTPHQALVRSVMASTAEGKGLQQLPNLLQRCGTVAGAKYGEHQEMQCRRRAELAAKEDTTLA